MAKVKTIIEVLQLIDPLFLNIVVVYGLSQVYQFTFGVDSVWQTFWDRIQDALGE